MASIIAFFAFLLVLALVIAFLEIQIEGKNGWASALPVWKIEKGWFVRYVYGGRPLTGYHLWMNMFLLLFIHFPVFFSSWNIRAECLVVGFYLAMWQIEDFLWFVFNPHFGMRKFKPQYIPWHPTWWGPVPSWYWFFPALWAPMFYIGLPVLTS